jgi:hypothetical protein
MARNVRFYVSCRTHEGDLAIQKVALNIPSASRKRLQENGTFLEFSPCLPRAYLGEMIVSCKKWNKQYRFSYLPRGAAATEICLATERLTDELRPCIACIMGCITQ